MKLNIKIPRIPFPLIMILSILIAYLCEPYMSHGVKEFFYSISISIKNFILTFIPYVVFIFLASSLTKIGEGVLKFALSLFTVVFISNFIAVIYGSFYGHLLVSNIPYSSPSEAHNPLSTIFTFPNMALIQNEYAIILGILTAAVILKTKLNHSLLDTLEGIATKFLRTILIPMVPLFIFGFIVKFRNDGLLENLGNYGLLMIVFTLGISLYNLFLLLVAAHLTKIPPLKIIRTILPACTLGFSTFSSVATMPVTITCLEKLVRNHSSAKMVVPATVSVHTVSTAVGINIITAAAFAIFGVAIPSLEQYLFYAFFFAASMFAVVAVPGGSIFVLAPIIAHYLGATPSMIAFITAAILVFDPIDTLFNIFSNSMFTLIIDKLKWKKL